MATLESNTFLKNQLIKPLSDENANICEGKITNEECKKAMGRGKSPGSEGLSSEFYKRFWDEVCDDVVQSINNAFVKWEPSICQRKEASSLFYQRKTNPPMS